MEIKQEIAQAQKRPETFADIRKETEARFRELVEAWMQSRSTFQTTLGAMQAFNNVFDRLEAAHKRERGNSTAMREALEPWIAFAEWLLENAGKDGLGKAIQENGPIIRQRLEELRDALAAPPRNCDMYTADELKVIFNSELVLELPIANEHEKNLVTITAMGVIDTLFATTKEGAAK